MALNDRFDVLRRSMQRRRPPGLRVADPEPIELPFPLPPGWRPLDTVTSEAVRWEIARETPRGHVLRDRSIRPLAQAVATDDVIVEIRAPDEATWAIVHLTHRVERDPAWPSAALFDDRAAVVRAAAEITSGG